jgi:hypothetical protein
VIIYVIASVDTIKAINDVSSTPFKTGDTILVLNNDIPEFTQIDTSTVEIDAQAINGTALAQANGRVVYTSNSTFNGIDTFTYFVKDTAGLSSNIPQFLLQLTNH